MIHYFFNMLFKKRIKESYKSAAPKKNHLTLYNYLSYNLQQFIIFMI